MKQNPAPTPLAVAAYSPRCPLAGCGSAAAGGDPETSAQSATVDDGVIPVASSAQPDEPRRHGHGQRRHGWFRKFDADGDGRIAIADLPENKREHVAAADANHDGFITRDEMQAMRHAKFEQMKAQADANHDGTVSEEERTAAHVRFAESRMMKHDANGDHALTQNEVSAKKWERIKKADANGDGRITSEEVAAAVKNGTLGRHHGHKWHGDDARKTGAPPAVL
jgi:Ca2+-binding EF-hand superfamily protein